MFDWNEMIGRLRGDREQPRKLRTSVFSEFDATLIRKQNAARTAWLLAILAAGALLAWWQVRQADGAMRASLLESARTVEQGVNPNSLRALTGTAADLKSAEYLRLKDQLAATRDANPQCRFIYLLGRHPDGAIFFFADNEPADSKACSPAGQVFGEASAGCRRVFDSREGEVEGPTTDRWGSWVSGLVPIFDRQAAQPGTGGLVAVLGMDIDARAWAGTLALAALPSVLLTVALAAVFLLGSKLLGWRCRLAGEPPRWARHIEPAMVVAAGVSLTLFATWEAHQREEVERIQTFEQLADAQAANAAEILRTIRDSELDGLAQFCAGNQMTSPADFENFTSSLAKNPAIQAWWWVPVVAAADRSRFEDAAREAGGMPGFEIWQENWIGVREPAYDRKTYYPAFCLAPRETNMGTLGYDLGSEPLLGAALEAAAATGLVTATDPANLLQDAEGEKRMLICHPVFDGGESKSLRGFALAVLRTDLLLSKASENSPVRLGISLLRKNAHPELLASNFTDDDRPNAEISVTHTLFAFGKVFAATAYPAPGSLRQTAAAGPTALAGVCLTAALAAATSLIRRRQKILEPPSPGGPAN
ncbi:MAG: CHASE domain-containing protein [Verrucomicrobiae bacterium]